MSKNKLVSLLCPLAFLVFGIWIKVSTLTMAKRDQMFPNLVAYLIIICAVIDFISEWRKMDHKDRFKGVNFVRLFACVAALFLYVFLIKKIGFFLDTLILCIFLMRLLGYKRWAVLIPSAIAITAVVFGVFWGLLNVPLPTIFL